MLTLTENAATAVKTIIAQLPDADQGGVRIRDTGSQETGFELAVASAPENGDQVVEAQVPRGDRAGLLDRLRERGVDFKDRGDSVLLYGDDGVASLDGDLDGYPVVRRPANLEDVFLRLTGRGLRDE